MRLSVPLKLPRAPRDKDKGRQLKMHKLPKLRKNVPSKGNRKQQGMEADRSVKNLEKNYDLIIVGAGPAGLFAAEKAARAGMKVLALDRKQEIGPPKRCAEGLGLGWFKRLKIKPGKEWAVQEICGAALYSPSGKKIEMKAKKTAGYVLERKVFEKMLAMSAAKAGAKIQVKSNVEKIERKGETIEVYANEYSETVKYTAPLIIAADGVDSRIARMMGKNTANKPYDMDSGFQYEMTNLKNYDEHLLHLYFGKEIAPRGYCLTGDSEIFAKHSTKPIAEIEKGEEVLTLNGWEKVRAKSERDYEGSIVKITPFMLNQEAKLTEDHLVLSWTVKEGLRWKKAGNLKRACGRGGHRNGDYLILPMPKGKETREIDIAEYYKKGTIERGKVFPKGRNQFGAEFKYKHGIPKSLKLTNELLELMGFFVAEGSTNSNGIILSNTKKELIEKFARIGKKTFGFEGNIWVQKRGNFADCYQLSFPSMILKQVFGEIFGIGSHNKKIPPEFMNLSEEGKKAFLKGLFLGDGCVEKSSENLDKLAYTTTSKHLIFDLWQILASIGVVGAIGKIKKKNAWRLRARGKQINTLENVFGKYNTGNHGNKGFLLEDNNIILGIRKLEKQKFNGKVYDIQTNGSFCPFFTVHNCWIFPKRKGTANVGIGIAATEEKSAKHYLDKFINANPGIFAEASIIEVNSGAIPVGGFLEDMTADNLIVTGDAAHMTDPIHGGGIGIAMEGGAIAAEIAIKAHKSKDYSHEFLKQFNAEWYSRRGNELKKRLKARHFLEKLNDDDFEYLAGSLTVEECLKIAGGELDKKEKFVMLGKKLLTRPKLALILKKYAES